MSVIPLGWLTRFNVAPAPIFKVPAVSVRPLMVMLSGFELASSVSSLPGESILAVNAVTFPLLGMHGANGGLQLHRVASVQFPPIVDQVAFTSPGICAAVSKTSPPALL